jgi:uncharacterized delta-60 repeat protein
VDLAGATNATLVLPDAQPAASGDYTVVVRNRSGELVSRPATLVVLGVPEILGLEGAVSLGIGDPLVLGVSARGVAPLAYQWRRDGVDLAGATGSAYTNRAVRLGDGGAYDVVVSNPLGSVTSGPLRISVSVRPGAVVGSFPDLGFGQGIKELNLLPDGGFLADGRALNRFGEQGFALPLTTTDLRGRIDVDAAAGRIYMVDGPRLAFDLSGVHLVGVPRPSLNMRLVRLEPDGHLLVSDNGVNPSLQRISPAGLVVSNFVPAIRPVIDAVVQPDGRVVVLSFTQRTQSGALVYDTVVARLLADGSNDPSFIRSTNTFPLNRRAEHLGLDRAGRVLVMGGLESFNGVPRSRLVRLNGDGTLDAGFRPPSIDGEVVEVATQLNGRLVIVGAFSNVDGQPRRLVARLNADGSHDPSFQPGTGLTRAAGQNIAFDVKVLPAGEIVVAGTFDAANGVPRRGLVLLAGDTQDLYFNREPADLEVLSGAAGELVAEATGTSAVGYQWYRDDVQIAGATGRVLSLGPAHAGVAGEYRVVIRNASGELTSRTAVVAVVVTPVVVAQPTSIVVDDGGTATFTVGANGRRLAYQWLRDGEPVGGGTNSSLSVAGAVASNAGRYSVVVSNPSGSVTSDEARLRVRPALAPVGGIPTDGIVGEVLFETGFAEKSNRFPTIVKGAPTRVDGIQGGQAARFRSGVDCLQLGTGTAALGGTAYSASFWIWPEEQGSVHVYSLTLFLGTQRREHYLYLGGDDTVVGGQRVFLATRGLTSVHSSDDRAYVPNLMGRWTHVAVVYRGGGPSQANNFTVYLDGVAVPLVNSANTVTGVNSGNGLGMHGPSAAFRLDDFRIYNRGLGADEVARLRDTAPPTPKPAIIAQPAGGSAAAGGAFTFTVGASGSDLFYEWFRGTTSLPEADGPSLTLSALAPVDAGDYRVVISNRGGSVESTPAALAVTAGADGFATWASAAGLAGALAEAGSDPDQDGASNLAEFTYGTSPTLAADRPGFQVSTVSVDGSQYPAIVFRRRQALGDVRMEVEVATGVGFGDATPGQVVSLTPAGDGLDRVVIRGGRPAGSVPAQFFRVTVRR